MRLFAWTVRQIADTAKIKKYALNAKQETCLFRLLALSAQTIVVRARINYFADSVFQIIIYLKKTANLAQKDVLGV